MWVVVSYLLPITDFFSWCRYLLSTSFRLLLSLLLTTNAFFSKVIIAILVRTFVDSFLENYSILWAVLFSYLLCLLIQLSYFICFNHLGIIMILKKTLLVKLTFSPVEFSKCWHFACWFHCFGNSTLILASLVYCVHIVSPRIPLSSSLKGWSSSLALQALCNYVIWV